MPLTLARRGLSLPPPLHLLPFLPHAIPSQDPDLTCSLLQAPTSSALPSQSSPPPITRFPFSSGSRYPHPVLPPSPFPLLSFSPPPTSTHFTPPDPPPPSPDPRPPASPPPRRQARRGAGAPGSLARAQPAALGGALATRALGVFYNPGRRLRKCRPRAPSPGHAAARSPSSSPRPAGETAAESRRRPRRAGGRPRVKARGSRAGRGAWLGWTGVPAPGGAVVTTLLLWGLCQCAMFLSVCDT